MFEQVDVSGDQKIDYEEFVAMLKLMDRRLKSLPATAQVASQQVRPYNYSLYSLFRYISSIITLSSFTCIFNLWPIIVVWREGSLL